jgi:hypothetical protein
MQSISYVGSRIYLHETQGRLAWHGGTITQWSRMAPLYEPPHDQAANANAKKDARKWGILASLIETALCRARHNAERF